MASKVAEVEQPGVCSPQALGSPQWLSAILASTPGPPNHRRRLDNNVFAYEVNLRTAVEEYENNAAAATTKYGPIADWDVSGITCMCALFKDLPNFNANITNWDTSSVTNMVNMFTVRFACALRLQPSVAGPSPYTCRT